MEEELRIRLKATLFGLAMMGSAAWLSVHGPRGGPARTLGQWLWAAVLLLLAHFMFFVPLRRWMTPRQVLVLELTLLAFGGGVFGYAWWIGHTLHSAP